MEINVLVLTIRAVKIVIVWTLNSYFTLRAEEDVGWEKFFFHVSADVELYEVLERHNSLMRRDTDL